MPQRHRKVTVCGKPLHGLQHICAFFDSRQEQYDVLNPYFLEGLQDGDEVVTIVESAFHDEHLLRMGAGNVPVQEAMDRGQLKVLASEQTYVQDGIFVVDRMYDLLQQALLDSRKGPYGTVRTFGDMEWALKNLPGTEELMAYEAKINLMAPDHDCTLMCGYDLNRFSGRAIADVLATHSHVVMGNRVYENPYYVEPIQFLEKLALRRAQNAPVGIAT